MSDQHERPRVQEANRGQVELRAYDLERAIPERHRARRIWAALERLDLSAFYAPLKARGSTPGRPSIDPKILLALWLYATCEGVGSARLLERLCERDDAYRWICGGVSVNHHTLSDFRVEHGEKLDELMTQLLAVLMHQGLLRMKRIAQDGLRVRASAGAASFRRGPTLEQWRKDARERIEHLREELESEPGASEARERESQLREALEEEKKLSKALEELEKSKAVKLRTRVRERSRRKIKKTNDDAPRVSTTDPEARVMKMPDGGFRPAYNMQFATDVDTGIVVGVRVTNVGADAGQMMPMLDELEHRCGVLPEEHLVDGGYTNLQAIDAAERRGVKVYAPVPRPRHEGIDPFERRPRDTDYSVRWRQRMSRPEAKAIYVERGATAELLHADLREWRGFRGLVSADSRRSNASRSGVCSQ